MPSYLDFDSTKNFRDKILGKTLNRPNGPQTFTKADYGVQNVSDIANKDLDNVDTNRGKDLLIPQNSNTFKPEIYTIKEDLNTLPRRSNLNLYPYFPTNGQSYNLIGIMNTDQYDMESELFKFAANNIKNNTDGPVYSRIAQNVAKNTLGRVRILDALNGNTTTAVNIITGREPLIESNYKITVDNTLSIPGQAANFLEIVSGIQLPFSTIPGDYLSNPSNPINYRPVAPTELGKLYQDVTGALGSLIGIKRRPKLDRKPSDLLIEHMGQGQKNRLFDLLSFSKYSPNYTTTARSQNTSKIFSYVDKAAQGVKNLLGLEAPKGTAYIGDDRGEDVKYAMNDFNDRPVRSSYYLTLLFDEVSANLFHSTKNYTEGGSISGKLSWISKNSKNELGANNQQYSNTASALTESLSTKYGFRTDSILGITQEILDSMPSDGGAARSHVANVIDQTSRIFQDGDVKISRGSAIKYTDKYGGEKGVEYCRVWTKDRPYSHLSDTMKRTSIIRKYDGSVMGGGSRPWNLNIGPMSNGRKSFDNSTNIKDGQAKKYMFSFENLAWKSSNRDGFRVSDLPVCERGPNGGRVMWFPPYDLKVSEQNAARWEENSFLGRPEPIYTYQNTARSGQVSFKVVVDHPSILNLLVREHFGGMSDEESENYINAFFAGCKDEDFYSLIQKYTQLDQNDVNNIKAYLNAGSPKEIIKKFKYTSEDVKIPKPDTNSEKTNQPAPFEKQFYFDNDFPKVGTDDVTSSQTYSQLYAAYSGKSVNFVTDLGNDLLRLFTGNTANDKIDIVTLFGDTTVTGSTKSGTTISTQTGKTSTAFTELTNTYNSYISKINEIKLGLKNNNVKSVNILIQTSTSEVADDTYNFYLGVRRIHSIIIDVFDKIKNEGKSPKLTWPTKKQFSNFQKKGFPISQFPFEYSFEDLGYVGNKGSIVFAFMTQGENTTLSNGGGEKNLNCKTELKTTYGLKTTAPVAFFCRQANFHIDYTTNPTETKQPTTITIPKIKIEEDEPQTIYNSKPPIDVMKRIIMKTLSECFYFKQLEEKSPVAFTSLKEKLKYFHPGFHSTTPEGLNSRLTFLLQCVRPGDTIPIKGTSDNADLNARNTSFGPPPVCVMRIGDFYHSKIIIRDINISYDDSPWDMNPEGIGYQPMIATVQLQVSFIGGQGLEKPVERLQNALSSNFFANTEMYDERSDSTTTTMGGKKTDEFTKEFLEELKKKPEFQLDKMKEDNKTEVTEGTYIGTLSGTKLNYDTLVNSVYSTVSQYTNKYQSAYTHIVKTYGKKIGDVLLSPTYRTINTITGSTDGTISILGEYPTGLFNDLETIVLNIKSAMNSAITLIPLSSSVFDLLEFGDPKVDSYDQIFKDEITFIVNQSLDSLVENKQIKDVENARNEVITVIDKTNFLVTYGHDVQISGLTYTKSNLTGFNGTTFYNQFKPAITYLKSASSQNVLELEPTNPNFTELTLSFNSEDLKSILSILLIGKKDTIVQQFARNPLIPADDIGNVSSMLDSFIYKEPTLTLGEENRLNIILGPFPVRPNDKPIEFEISSTEDMTNEAERFVANNIFINKNKLGTTLNFYKP
jgi:hypothetical protein